MSKQDRHGTSARSAPYSVPNRSAQRFRISDAVSIVKNVVPEWLTRWTKGENVSDFQRRSSQRAAEPSGVAPSRPLFPSRSEQTEFSAQRSGLSPQYTAPQRATETQFKLPNPAASSLQRRPTTVSTDSHAHAFATQGRRLERVTESSEALNESVYVDASSRTPPSRNNSLVRPASASRGAKGEPDARSSRKREHSLNDDDSTSGISSNNDGDTADAVRLRPQPSANGPSRFSQFLERNRRTPAAAPDPAACKRARYLELAPTGLRREPGSLSSRSVLERTYSPLDGRSSGATTPLFSPRFRHALSIASDQQSTLSGRLSSSMALTDADGARFAALLGSRLSTSFSTQSVASTSASTATASTLRRRSSRPSFDPHAVSTDFLTPLFNATQSNANSTLSKSASLFPASVSTPVIESRRSADTPSAPAGSTTAKLILERLSKLDAERRDRPGDEPGLGVATSLQSLVPKRTSTSAAELFATVNARNASIARTSAVVESPTISTVANQPSSAATSKEAEFTRAASIVSPASVSASVAEPTTAASSFKFFKVPNAISMDTSATKVPTSSGRSDTQPEVPKLPSFDVSNVTATAQSNKSSAAVESTSATKPFTSSQPLQFTVPTSSSAPLPLTSISAPLSTAAANEMELESAACGGKIKQRRYLGNHTSGGPMSTSHQFVAGAGGNMRVEDMDDGDRLVMPDLPAVSLPPLTNLPTFRFASPYGFPSPATSSSTVTSTNGHTAQPVSAASASNSPLTFSFSKPVVFGQMTSSPILPSKSPNVSGSLGGRLVPEPVAKPNGFSFTFAKPLELANAAPRDTNVPVAVAATVNEFRSQLRFSEPLKLNGTDANAGVGGIQLQPNALLQAQAPPAPSGERVVRKAVRRARQ